MIDYSKLTNNLISSVGIRNTINPDYPKLGDSVVFSEGKSLIRHPLLTIENIIESAKDFNDYEFPEFDPAKEYNNDDPYSNRVYGSDGNVYEYINPNPSIGNDPVGGDGSFWEQISLETLYLEDIYKNAVYEVVSYIMTSKANRYETKSLLQYQKIYQGSGKLDDKIVSTGSLVGFEIIPKRNENISVILEKIGTHFDQTTDVVFYLFHSSHRDPIKTFTISHLDAENFQWHDINEKLNYVSDDYDAGGIFYLMYDQDQVTGQAINKRYDYFKSCSYCSQYDNYARSSRKDFYLIRSVEIRADDRIQSGGNEKMFDVDDVIERNLTTYGLNLSVQAKCDLTDIFIDQKDIISKVLNTKVKIDLLHELAHSTRTNRIEERVKKEAKFALQSKITGGEGLLSRYEKELDEFDFNMSNLNSRCFPKKKAGRGIRTTSHSLFR